MAEAKQRSVHQFKSDIFFADRGLAQLSDSKHTRSATAMASTTQYSPRGGSGNVQTPSARFCQQKYHEPSEIFGDADRGREKRSGKCCAQTYYSPSRAFDGIIAQAKLSPADTPQKTAPSHKRTAGVSCEQSQKVAQKKHLTKSSSELFRPLEAQAPKVNPHAPKDHAGQDMFGNFPAERMESPRQQVSAFTPKYDSRRAVDRKRAEFNGNTAVCSDDRISTKYSLPGAKTTDLTSTERKLQNLGSSNLGVSQYNLDLIKGAVKAISDKELHSTFFGLLDTRSAEQGVDHEVHPKTVSHRQYRSRVLGGSQFTEPSPAFDPGWNESARKADHLYSDDLFGAQEGSEREVRSVAVSPERLVPNSSDWRSSTYLGGCNNKADGATPAERRQQNLRSSLDGYRSQPVSRLASPAPEPTAASPRKVTAANPQVATISIRNLSPEFTAKDLADINSKQIQIVDTQLDQDNVAGTCTGTGTVAVRFTDQSQLSRFKSSLVEAGIEFTDKKLDAGSLKSNYLGLATANTLDTVMPTNTNPRRAKKELPSSFDTRVYQLSSTEGVFDQTRFQAPTKSEAKTACRALRDQIDSRTQWTQLKKMFDRPKFRSKYEPILRARKN